MIHEGTLRTKAKHVVMAVPEVLKPSGFGKSGDVYSRQVGRLLHMVDVQYSRWNDPTEVAFTLNCGIYARGVTSTFRNTVEPKKPKLTDCCVSARVGMLTDEKLDVWWKLLANDSREREAILRTELRTAIQASILPFLERFSDERGVAAFLSHPRDPDDEYVEPRAPALKFAYAAILWRELADKDECQRCMAGALKESKGTPLEDVIIAFERRFTCQPRP